MADSLSVACQTMLAKSLAVRDTTSARQVGRGSGCDLVWCGVVAFESRSAKYGFGNPAFLLAVPTERYIHHQHPCFFTSDT